MILIPTVLVLLFILLMTGLKKYEFSETLMTIFIFVGTFIVIGSSVLIIIKGIITKAQLDYDGFGLTITILSNSIFFPKIQQIPFSSLRLFSVEEDTNGRAFISIKTQSPLKSILLFPLVQDEPEAFLLFGEQLKAYIAHINMSLPQYAIQQTGFYEGRWMKGLAIAAILLVILVTGFKIYKPESVSYLRLLFMYVVSIPFIYKVFQNRSQ